MNLLTINNLVKKYNDGLVALNDVSLNMSQGEIIALIGPSGAGKSTFIRCINRLVDSTGGEVLVNGKDIAKLSRRDLKKARKNIGMIFQEFALVEQLTVMENVLSGTLGGIGFWRSAFRKFDPIDVDRALRLLERLGLADYIDSRADKLSGGQRQRVGIARALMQQPKMLLIDEPTASLDPRTSRDIMRLIVELADEHQVAAIINIHDVELAKTFCQRIVGLAAGVKVFDGKPDKLTDAQLTDIYGGEDWLDKDKQKENEDFKNNEEVGLA